MIGGSRSGHCCAAKRGAAAAQERRRMATHVVLQGCVNAVLDEAAA
jgi:hypothetical protein